MSDRGQDRSGVAEARDHGYRPSVRARVRVRATRPRRVVVSASDCGHYRAAIRGAVQLRVTAQPKWGWLRAWARAPWSAPANAWALAHVSAQAWALGYVSAQAWAKGCVSAQAWAKGSATATGSATGSAAA